VGQTIVEPDLDTKNTPEGFIFGYYKESAQPLWDYEMMMWDFWEKLAQGAHKCGGPSDNPLLNNLQCSYAPDGPMFTPDFMTRTRNYFNPGREAGKKTMRTSWRESRRPRHLCYIWNYRRISATITEFRRFHVRQEHPEIPRGEREYTKAVSEMSLIDLLARKSETATLYRHF